MINLLPDDSKRSIRAARTNVLLVRYCILSLGGIALLFGMTAIFYLVLYNMQSSALSSNSDNSTIAASYSDTRKQADEYRSNLATASQILSNGANYTNVIFSLAQLLPSGVVMDEVTLSATDFGQQLTFSSHATTYDKATQLKENFQTSPMFSNVYLQSATDESSGGNAGAYPIAVTISAKLEGVTP